MNAGLVFNESSNIELCDFAIDSCGMQINHEELTNVTGNANKYIVFVNMTNVVLQGLVVANSNGYGLMISDCFGSVLLKNNIFDFHIAFLVFLCVLIQPYKVYRHNFLESAFFINLLFVTYHHHLQLCCDHLGRY